MTPYAYTLLDANRNTRVFPTLGEAVRFLIDKGYPPAKAADMEGECSLRAHAVASDPQSVDLSPYLERTPVDEAAIRAELAKAVADSHAEYVKRWPHGRTGPRFSGDHMLCESSSEELERMIQCEIARRGWRWKAV